MEKDDIIQPIPRLFPPYFHGGNLNAFKADYPLLFEFSELSENGITPENFIKGKAAKYENGEGAFFDLLKHEIGLLKHDIEFIKDIIKSEGGTYTEYGTPLTFEEAMKGNNYIEEDVFYNFYVLDIEKIVSAHFCQLNGKSATPEFIPKEQTTSTKKTISFVPLSRKFTTTEQEILFKELKDGGFIAKNTNYSHFCAVFGNTPIPENKQPFTQLEWIKKSDVTKEKSLCKRSLLDLLQILGIRETDIKEICKNSFKNYKGHHFVNDKKTKELKTHSQFHDDLLKIKDRLSDKIKEK